MSISMSPIHQEDIQNRIFTIRDQYVLIGRDLDEMFGILTNRINGF